MADIKRPTGVLILVAVYIVLGLLRFGEAGLMLAQDFTGGALLAFCLAPTVLLGIFCVVVAVGLYGLKRWAWIIALVIAVLGLLYAVARLAGYGIGASALEEVEINTWLWAVPVVFLALNLTVLVVLVMNRQYFD